MAMKSKNRTEEINLTDEMAYALDYMVIRSNMDEHDIKSDEYRSGMRSLQRIKKKIYNDKSAYVHNIGVVLSQTSEGILNCVLMDNNTVRINYGEHYIGTHTDIDITDRNWSTILKEVAKCL